MGHAAIFYVYIIFRPWDGSPCYVGKGKERRALEHKRLAPQHYNKRLGRIFQKADRLNLDVPIIIIRNNLTERQAFEIERAFIAAIGRADKGHGPLVNLTDGGEGVSGIKISEKTRAKMSVSGTAARLGKKYSPEHCAALSKSRAMREPATAETRGKMSISARKRDRSGGYSADQKASIRAGILAFWQARRERGLPLKHPRKNK